DGSRFPLGLAGAEQVDRIGADVHVACLAVRLQAAPWRRIVALTGTRAGPGARADVALTAELVARLAHHDDDLAVLVLAPTPAYADPFRAIERATFSGYRPRSGDALEQLAEGDLLVVPAHAVADAGLLARARLQRALSGVSVAVIGGPGRLQVSIMRTDR